MFAKICVMKASTVSPDFLLAELHARGLSYLLGPVSAHTGPRLQDYQLLAQLTMQQDARLRSSLIPLFLSGRQFTDVLPLALEILPREREIIAKIYYTVAVLLQKEHQSQLMALFPDWQPIPDLFSVELDIDHLDTTETKLRQLGIIHARLVGLQANWPGTYRHAARQFINHLQAEKRWVA